MRTSAFWDVTVPRIMSSYAVAIFVILWVGFAVALIVNRTWLDVLWDWSQSLPIVARVLVWLGFLPILVALWIWESTWGAAVRVLAFGGVVVWTLLAVSSFFKAFR